MCGYAGEGAPATAEDLIAQFECAMERSSPEVSVVKIYTSGSFLDRAEMPLQARDEILKRLAVPGNKEAGNRDPSRVCDAPRRSRSASTRLPTEFAIGLETASDLIRENVIRKGFSFQDFVDASEAVHRQGGHVKAYLLLKPPLLSEGQAMRDAISLCPGGPRPSRICSHSTSAMCSAILWWSACGSGESFGLPGSGRPWRC